MINRLAAWRCGYSLARSDFAITWPVNRCLTGHASRKSLTPGPAFKSNKPSSQISSFVAGAVSSIA